MTDRISTIRTEQHVLDIAARHRVTIHRRDDYRAYAATEFMEIRLPRIRSAITYGTALHELGHCLGRHQTSRYVMVAERWAWRSAKANVLVWTATMERNMCRSLAWYEVGAPWAPRIVHGPPGCHVEPT
jgi:hypothetical protein